MKPETTLRQALLDPNLLDLGAPSWAAWRPMLLAIMGEPLLPDELEVFRKFTGRTTAPERRVDEGWLVVGRRGGKTRAMAALAVYIAALLLSRPPPCQRPARLCPNRRPRPQAGR
jgi:hypothetical protein